MSLRSADDHGAAPDEPDRPRTGLLFDDLAAQLDRFLLLPGGSDSDAERGVVRHAGRGRDPLLRDLSSKTAAAAGP